jgi:hypothetical protein
MIGLLWSILAILISPCRSNARLEAENAVLRHQLLVLRRKCRGRVRLTNFDRWIFVQLYRLFSIRPPGPSCHPTRDARAVASGRVSQLLAMEVPEQGRASADRYGPTRANQANDP